MIQSIRRPNLFSLYDRSGMIRYLKKMASRGWLLCGIGSVLWKFRRIKPQELDFSISYDRKGEAYDFRTSDRQQGLVEMGTEAGWTLAAASAAIQVFWTDRQDAVPMQTDPVSELGSITTIMRKTIRNELIVLALLVGLWFLRSSTYLRVILIDMLTDSAFVSGCISYLLLIIAAAAEWGVYFAWRKRAERAAQTGAFAKTPRTRILSIVMIILIAAFMICQLAPFLWHYPRTTLSILIPTVITIGAMSAAMAVAVRILRNKGFSAAKNRLITAGTGFVVGMVLIYMFVSLSGTLALPVDPEERPVDLPVEIYMDSMPGASAESVETVQKYSSSIIAESHIVEQNAPEGNDSAASMRYRVTKIRTGLFRKALISSILKQFNSTRSVTENSTFWGADEALQATSYYGKRNNYMLVFGNYILDIDFSWEPTAEQKAYIGQIMQNIAYGQ